MPLTVSDNVSTGRRSYYVDKAFVKNVEPTFGERQPWQEKWKDDTGIKVTFDIGKSFEPIDYIGGAFKKDPINENVIGWSTVTKVKIFLNNCGLKISLDNDKPVEDNQITEDLCNLAKGKSVYRLNYRSTRVNKNGDPLYKFWQETGHINDGSDGLEKKFLEAVERGWVNDYGVDLDGSPMEMSKEELEDLVL